MRQRLLARLRWLWWPGSARSRARAAPRGRLTAQPGPAGGRHRRADGPPAAPANAEAVPVQPPAGGPFASPVQEARARPARPSRPPRSR